MNSKGGRVNMDEVAAKTLSIEELLRQVRDGQPGAWEALFQRSQPALTQWASHQLGGSPPAGTRKSDLVQETALRAFQRFPSFHGETGETWFAWLKELQRKRFLDISREAHSQKRSMDATESLEELDPHQLVAAQRSPSQFAAQQEEFRQLLGYVYSLPKEQRKVVFLYYLQDLSDAEIAQHLDKSADAVSSLRQRAVRAIRDRRSGNSEKQTLGISEDAIIQNAADAALLLYMRKQQQGEQVDVEAFVADHPQCAEELRSLLSCMQALYMLKPTDSK